MAVQLRLPSRNTLLFIGLSLLWYSCSFLSASTSKALLSGKKVKPPRAATQYGSAANGTEVLGTPSMQTPTSLPPLFPYPVSLTALQFLAVFAFSYTLCSPTIARHLYRLAGRSDPPRDPDTGRPKGLMSTLIMVDRPKLQEMVGLSLFSVSGHAMTSTAIQMVPVSTVHTVKALSPLFTVLSYVFILHLSYPFKTYLSLLPLTLGVILACSGLSTIEGSKAWLGVLLSVGSTIVFVAQNLWSKKLLGHALSGAAPTTSHSAHGSTIKLDKLNILFWSSGVSFLLLLPILIYSDLPKMGSRSQHGSISLGDLDSNNNVSYNATAAALHARGVATSGLAPPAPSTTWKIVRLLISNGSVHFLQSLLAFSILGLTSPVTYSIASLFKRVFVICFAIIWFGQTVTSVQWIGIILTFLGLYLYNDSKHASVQSTSDVGASSSSVAAKEAEAAEVFGIEKGNRRRTGLLPTSSSSSAPGPGPGPIWKGMSSSLISGSHSQQQQQQQHPHHLPAFAASAAPKRD